MQPGMDNPFNDPSPPGGGNAPRPRDMVGCLVAYQPTQFTPAGAPGNVKGYENDAPRDRVTAHLFVLEGIPGQPVYFGGTPELEGNKAKPHTHQVFGPARFRSVWISNTTIVDTLRDNLTSGPGGGPGLVLGRIERSQIGNQPFNIVSVKGTPDMDKGIYLWTALSAGSMAWNEPTLIGGAPIPQGPPPAAAAQPVYVPPPAQPQYAWQGPPPGTPPAPAQPQYGPPPGYPQQPAYTPPQGQYPPSYGAPMVAPQIEPAPQGWDPQVWANLQPGERAQIMATINGAMPGQMPPGVAPAAQPPTAGRW